jgi:preprotein translocase subunit SecA
VLVSLIKKIFGTDNMRTLKRLQPLVNQINELEPVFKQKTDAELKAMTPLFRDRLEQGETLDDLLPEAFAAVREASQRTPCIRGKLPRWQPAKVKPWLQPCLPI